MISGRPRILCVDDEPEILKFLDAVLVRNGYEVIKASDGEEALRKIEEGKVDLILSDVKIPKVDGIEVCRRTKGDGRFHDIPVILMTGFAAKTERIKGIEAGAEDFLAKPVDQAEVLARIKMLLKARALNERRMGELLVEMNFVTEDHLQEALRVAKEGNIKLGEALYSMGALDKDHIYWVLSNQLEMNYIELSPEMLDQDLIRQFPVDLLEDLGCLPLYETAEEIHFAIADPTNRQVVEKVKALRPTKNVQLHLALPEKIRGMLNSVDRSHAPENPLNRARLITGQPRLESVWNDFKSLLLSMPQRETYWLVKTPDEGRLLSQKDNDFKTLQEYPEKMYAYIRENLKQNGPLHNGGGAALLFLQGRTAEQQGAFKWRRLFTLSQEIIRIDRIPIFSAEKFMRSYPQASDMIGDLQRFLRERPLLFLGGPDRAFMKQCCYLSFTGSHSHKEFPPPFFVEEEMETCFPKVAQVPKDQVDLMDLLDHFWSNDMPPLFFESELDRVASDRRLFERCASGLLGKVVFGLSFLTPETMQETLSGIRDWDPSRYHALFISPGHLKSI